MLTGYKVPRKYTGQQVFVAFCYGVTAGVIFVAVLLEVFK